MNAESWFDKRMKKGWGPIEIRDLTQLPLLIIGLNQGITIFFLVELERFSWLAPTNVCPTRYGLLHNCIP